MKLFSILLILLSAAALRAADEPNPPGFDPARHMRVSEVKIGMTGYGLSVFKGTDIQRFEVKVLAVLKNFNPKYDVVLIDCKGQNLEHTEAIAGMSGSPVFLTDDQGRSRLIGAFAYGWPMMKDPIAGVQPIEYMLAIPAVAPAAPDAPGKAAANAPHASAGRMAWSLRSLRAFPTGPQETPLSLVRASGRLGDGNSIPRMTPLATPLMTSGFSAAVLDRLRPALASASLIPMETGAAATSPDVNVKLEPGSVLAVPLIWGDADMTAIGTCTEVLGNRVLGFGHAFNGEGPINLPMGAGQVSAIIANLTTSFKIGSMTSLSGSLVNDQTVGVAGLLGPPPPSIPMDIKLVYTDGSADQTYHFNLAQHPKLTPVLAAAAFGAALTGAHDLPQYHTLDYDIDFAFANGQTVHLSNTAVNVELNDLMQELSLPTTAASENPFEQVMLKQITGTVRVTPKARDATILSVSLPQSKYQPGDTAKLYVTYRPFRGTESILPVEFEIPHDLPDGTYPLQVSDWTTYLQDEQAIHPFRFTAQSTSEVFDAIKDVMGLRRNAIYLQLLREADGVAIGRTAMPHLPSSKRDVLLQAGLSNTTPFVSTTLKVVPTDLIFEGSADFEITIDRQDKVDAGGPHAGAKHEGAKPAPAPSPKNDEPKAKPPAKDGSAGSES